MERFPGESDTEYHTRQTKAARAQRQLDLLEAKAEAQRTGKEPFDEVRFRQAYLGVKPYAPTTSQEFEIDYYLDHRRARTLQEYLDIVRETDLYDGGDMHLDW